MNPEVQKCWRRRLSVAAALFVDEPNGDCRLAWPAVELGISPALQIGGRLNTGSSNFEDPTDPGASANLL